ncbi:MAG TPA: DEAD/DEAH box helicase [Byssovorax sp.]|jgi:DEAD/DEAH box helicase domain-containing protein
MREVSEEAGGAARPKAAWHVEVGLTSVVDRWLRTGAVRECLTADRELPGRAASTAPLPEAIDPRLGAALEGRGIDRVYAHQDQAIRAAMSKRHVVVATPTASGKSLCFHLPVLSALANEPDASALYLYPTKALARDQEAGVRALIAESGLAIPAIVYDGDTPGDARRAAREKSPIVMTNPDMLHAGILPHHANWARTLQKLRYVVIDELHVYRGVFGSHVAHVLARLRRAARFHGADPTFLCATATIGNPREHAARLVGVEEHAFELVDRSGAPAGPRRVLVYNPPVVNAELGVRASSLKAAVRLAADLVRARVPTILFGASRNSVEIMLKYLRERVGAEVGDGAIMAYRGGYLPETRRGIERGLRQGEILCVVATNALELGIDIGELDAVICVGYPGSVAGTWQRFGRAGRRGAPSAAVLVASSAPVDQYLATNPSTLFDAAVESARIDPWNAEIVVQHLKCAAFELPFVAGESYAGLPEADTRAALEYLADSGVLHASSGRFHWSADAYPASHVSLRTVGWDNFVIVDVTHGKALAELDFRAAHTMLHEQAIYQHDGEQYQVERLDFENHKAYVRKVEPDYFTTALTNKKVSILDLTAHKPLFASGAPRPRARASWGEISVIEKVVGYKKVKFHTHENAGYGDVRLPDMQMHTTSCWLALPLDLVASIDASRASIIDGLRGVGAALETVAALALMCDPRDLGRSLECLGDDGATVDAEGEPTLFLFDNVPGGVGLAERVYLNIDALLERARALVSGCACEHGCPACVGAADASASALAPPLRKRTARRLLDALV